MRTLVAVLGMHRSGTSATTGMLQDYGLELGAVNEQDKHNARGNREFPELNQLHNRILERHGGAWWNPPADVVPSPEERAERDAILGGIEGDTVAIKDPRILLLLDFWRELSPLRIGVIRNPVAVRESLHRRATSNGKHSPLRPRGWEKLWGEYNRRLLAEHDREPFPIINFDLNHEFDAQVRASLRHHGIEPQGEAEFFERGLLHDAPEWRSKVLVKDSLRLYDELAERALAEAPAPPAGAANGSLLRRLGARLRAR